MTDKSPIKVGPIRIDAIELSGGQIVVTAILSHIDYPGVEVPLVREWPDTTSPTSVRDDLRALYQTYWELYRAIEAM